MVRKKISMRLMPLVVAFMMIISLAACGDDAKPSSDKTTGKEASTSVATTTAVKEKTPVKLNILIGGETGIKWNSYPDNPVAKEIEKQTGVSFNFIESDENKLKVLLAGGDLPDIIRISAQKYSKQLIEGNLIIPLDDLLGTNGQDIANNVPKVLEISRKNWSEGQNKLYFVTPQVQPEPAKYYFEVGGPSATMRWDYYKELGCPEINSADDLLKVLADMQAKHPKTDDGKKVYGLSMWNDWGLWSYQYPGFFLSGEATRTAGALMAAKINSTQLNNIITTEDCNFWTMVSLFYKAKKMGLLDPDALTMKFDDYKAKATAGQILCGPTAWAMGDFNANNAKDGKGFMAVPAGKYAWFQEILPTGFTDKQYCISKNCKTPDRAMDLLNFIFSYDGARIMWNGVKGKDWDVVDGKPQLKAETIALQSTGGENWDKSGIQLEGNFIGLGGNVINPADGLPVSLFEIPEVFESRLSPLQKDFCSVYGIKYPGEIFEKKAQEGKFATFSNESKDISVVTANTLIASAIAQAPDDIKKIESKLSDLAAKHAAKCVLAKSDAEFEANKAKALADFKEAGADTLTQWYTNAWNEAKAKVGAK